MGGEFTFPKMVPLVLTHSHLANVDDHFWRGQKPPPLLIDSYEVNSRLGCHNDSALHVFPFCVVSLILGVDSPFFSAIVLFQNRSPILCNFGGWLERFGSLGLEWGSYP